MQQALEREKKCAHNFSRSQMGGSHVEEVGALSRVIMCVMNKSERCELDSGGLEKRPRL